MGPAGRRWDHRLTAYRRGVVQLLGAPDGPRVKAQAPKASGEYTPIR